MAELYPWQQQAFEKLRLATQQDRNPHGLLLTARRGTGAEQFARYWSQFVLCRNGNQQPCGECKSCQLIRSDGHPDFYWIERQEDKKQISIDQIRMLTASLHETANLSGWRVAVIFEAEKLTISGYNALLKTLEEPGKNTQLVLLAEQRSAIPATIVSRCQNLSIEPSSIEYVHDWLTQQCPSASKQEIELALAVCHGAPLTALDWLQHDHQALFEATVDKLLAVFQGKMSAAVLADDKSLDVESLLYWWEYLTVLMVKSRQNRMQLSNSVLNRASELAENADERLLFKFRDEILFQLKELREGVALNLPMQLDYLAQQWSRCRTR